jgi:UDP-N-acetylmuramoylalanine--D-glutamate ligase
MTATHPALAGLAGARVCLLGAGREGLSSLAFLRAAVPDARLTVADRTRPDASSPELAAALADPGLAWLTGDGYADALAGFDVVVRSPGIPPTLPALAAARAAGVRVTSNMALFLAMRAERVVGVTGTKGKSTTSSLLHTMLRSAGLDARLVGNIGHPALSELRLDDPDEAGAVYVAELSSHQLADLTVSPHLAVVHHVVPEHLDYYASFERYLDAKANIAAHQGQGDLVAFDHDSAPAAAVAARSPGARASFGFGPGPSDGRRCTVEDGWVVERAGGDATRLVEVARIGLRGRHNVANVLAAALAARLLGVPPEAVARAARGFTGLPHRLEPVASVDGVAWFDDSLATVPEAAMAAIESFAVPAVLIAGGEDRGQDFAALAELLRRRARAVVLLPPSGERLRAALGADAGRLGCVAAASMGEAVAAARAAARPGDVVLLSPAAASRGLFRDYADRGQQFKTAVAELAGVPRR